jgi:hypothetical protein
VSAAGTAVARGTAITPAVPWSLGEAAEWLRPRVTERQLTRIASQLPGFLALSIGTRPTGGRPERVWDMADIQELHADLRRWL